MSGVWVFGYGSLVDPASFGRTLGRELTPGVDVFEAELHGFGRRWNYGIMHTVGLWSDDDGLEHERTIVALGVVGSVEESVNGVVGWVRDHELGALDRRERVYDRVDVTSAVTADLPGALAAPVMVYVPRPEAICHYERARDEGTAAIDHDYWSRVDRAFAALGSDHRTRYHERTPPPDVPVLPLRRR